DGTIVSDYENNYDYLDALIMGCYEALKELREKGTAQIYLVEPMREIYLSISDSDVKVEVHHVYRKVPEIKEAIVSFGEFVEGIIMSSNDLLNLFDGENVRSYVLSEMPDFNSFWRPRKMRRLEQDWIAEHGIEWTFLSPQDLREWMDWAQKWLEELKTE
ncbi:MAG: hypothetical protein V3U09_06645, partial [Thermoplasmata archaeon]